MSDDRSDLVRSGNPWGTLPANPSSEPKDEAMERAFPIQEEYRYKGAPYPRTIPWEVAMLAYVGYAEYCGTQKLKRLAERGGFAPSEMDEFLPDWRERISKLKEGR